MHKRKCISCLGVKTAWRSNPVWGFAVWGSILFGDPKLPLDFGVILEVILEVFFVRAIYLLQHQVVVDSLEFETTRCFSRIHCHVVCKARFSLLQR